MTCDVLLLGAFHPELAPLKALLGEVMRAQVGGADVAARAVGIGLPASAVGAAMQLGELEPRLVVLVGTCGAYRGSGSSSGASGSELSIGDVAVPGRLHLTAPCVVDGMSQVPDAMTVELAPDAALVDGLLRAGGLRGDVATTLGITVDDEAAGRLARDVGARAEHLEAHGVATACAARGIPFAAALGVANYVGTHARQEWRTHHHAAASAAVSVVVRWLQSGNGTFV